MPSGRKDKRRGGVMKGKKGVKCCARHKGGVWKVVFQMFQKAFCNKRSLLPRKPFLVSEE